MPFLTNSLQERIWKPMIEAGANAYIRQRDLIDKRLIALWPKEANDYSIPGTEVIIERLQKIVRATYGAGLRGHWSYDINRHMGLLQALKGEQRWLEDMKRQRALWVEAQDARENHDA
jgi:hypothetical protein